MQHDKIQVDWIPSSPLHQGKRPLGWFLKVVLWVACTVVIAALLFPILAQPHISGGTSCLSNVKQIGTSVQMYLQDYDERFPRAAEWMDVTYPYIRSKGVYHCPKLDASHKNDFGYAFNTFLSQQPLAKHKAPEKMVVFYDANDLHWNASAPGRAGVATPPRHVGGDNFGFGDGHAKWQKLIGSDP